MDSPTAVESNYVKIVCEKCAVVSTLISQNEIQVMFYKVGVKVKPFLIYLAGVHTNVCYKYQPNFQEQ